MFGTGPCGYTIASLSFYSMKYLDNGVISSEYPFSSLIFEKSTSDLWTVTNPTATSVHGIRLVY